MEVSLLLFFVAPFSVLNDFLDDFKKKTSLDIENYLDIVHHHLKEYGLMVA